MAVVTLLIELAKIVLLIMQKRYEWTAEEAELFDSRVRDWIAEAKIILQNQENTFDYKAYINALSEADTLMFNSYYILIKKVLSEGKGLDSLLEIKSYAFYLKYPFIKDKLLVIWNKNISLDNKAKEMAREACDYVAP